MTVLSVNQSIYSRDRSGTQDRHHLPDPTSGIEELKSWENGLLKERVADLYRTPGGLPGHVRQIQQELNRVSIKNLNGVTPRHMMRIKQSVKTILNAVEAAKKSAAFPLPGDLRLGLYYSRFVHI